MSMSATVLNEHHDTNKARQDKAIGTAEAGAAKQEAGRIKEILICIRC